MKRLPFAFLLFFALAPSFIARADGYAVGEIPYEAGVSPSGGRTISVPIMTAPCRGTVPEVSICYNNQGGDGVAGFGWDIGGLSSITLAPKTMYYDGTVGEPDPSLPSSQVFALDGVRLVDNLESYDFPDYDYVTVQGRIFIQKVVSSNGEIVCFYALLPDGSRRRYGFSNNTSTKLTYPLTESIDPLGYYIKYTYIESGNRYYPTSIRYGSQNSSSLPSEIRFSYDIRSRSEEMFISGHQVLLSKLLTSVTSYNDGQVLRNYSFSHRLSGREMCLSQIDCSAPDGSALNPLFFSYGQTGADRGLVTERQMTLWSYPSGTGNRFRGKFLPQSYSDGLIAYTDGYPTYGIVQGDESAGDDLQFGSLFPANGIICVYKSLDTSALPYQITAGTGFQVAGAADIDGDGVDEMVKVNFGVFDEEESTLDITVFHFNESQTPSSYFGDVSVSGTVQDGDYYSPMSRSYFFGDFLGNGKTQLLSVAHSFNGYFGGTACFALIDLESLSIISETPMPLVYISPDTEDRFAAVDMDGDGRTELYNMMTADVYGISSTGAFSLKDNWGSAQGLFPRNRCFFGDVNGDGLPDIVAAPANSSPTYQNVFLPVWVPHVCPYCIQDEPIISSGSRICRHCGKDLFAYFLEDLPTKGRCYKCSAILSDMREDETYDQDEIDIDNCLFCHDHGFTFSRAIEIIPSSAKTWTVYKNNGKQFVSSTQQIIPVISGDSFQLMDLDRDGKMDLLRYRNGQFALFLNRSGQFASVPAGTLPVNGIPAGLGFQTMNAFGASHVILLTGSQVSTLSYGDFDSCLMTGVTDSFGNQTVSKYCTAYDSSGSYHPTSATVTFPFCQTFLPLTLVSESKMYMDGRSSPVGNNHFDYYGAVISRDGRGFRGFERTVERDSIRNRSTDMYYNPTLCVLTDLSTNTGHNSYIYSRQVFPNKEERILLLSEEDEDLLKGIISRKTYTYDIHGYPLSIEESRCFDTEEDETSEESTQMTYCHYFDQEEYVMGLVTSRSITRSKHQSDTVSWTERDDYSYDYDTKKIDQRIHYVCNGSDSEVSRTRWTYDSYGNPLTERTSVYGATGYVGKTFTYGSGGRTLASETDALGLTTTFSGYDRYGNPASSTDHLGRTTTYSYDSFGRRIKAVSPDGSVDSTAVAWGGKGKYTVSRYVSGAPAQITHYDALNREVRSEEQCFNGAWRKVDREYDSFGRLYRESLPFRGTSPLYWTVHTYDAYDRPTGVLAPSGKETTWTYGSAQSYSVTRVEDGIQTQSFIDASGSVTMVVDGGGTVSYDIRPDGQPSSVSVTGGGVTTFSYDVFGRRTAITDPSAGTMTTSRVQNSDGSSVVTETGPNGTVTSSYDRFGRITSRTLSSGGTTLFTYDAYGRIVSEATSGGTGKEWTYDAYDRISAFRETGPDGHFLQKMFAYGAGGNIASIVYTSQEGYITTEYYTYDYGHLRSVTLPGNKTVWRLYAENDLGQPTYGLTGGIVRAYGYNAYGLPTWRDMDDETLQNFYYTFSPTTGNLLSRQDENNETSETFSYDALNRLTVESGAVNTYAPNGNVLSRDGIGTMAYGNPAKPYQMTGFTPEAGAPIFPYTVTASYNERILPSAITSSEGYEAAFTFNADGERNRMTIEDPDGETVLSKYYLGGRYECEYNYEGILTEMLYLGGDAYSAPMVMANTDGNGWYCYNIGRDCLGSVTQIATENGSLVSEYSYDPWGRLRDPETLELYGAGSQPRLIFGRGFTGHEHLPWFGLINMNARLYDPLVGRFLSPDPYVQDPEFSQNFNRYAYALNNPLKYTDESGEFWHIVLGGIAGGTGNLISNWNNCDGFWQYFTAFSVGAAAGAAVAATGGAAAAAGGGFWATASVISAGAIGGAANGATNEIIKQTGNNFEGFDEINWDSVGISAAASGAAGGVGAGIGIAIAEINPPIILNGVEIASPIINSFAIGSISGGASHFIGGTTSGLLYGYSFGDALFNSLNGLGTSMLTGGLFSSICTAVYCYAEGVNPWYVSRDLPTAFDLGLNNEVNRIKSGNNYSQYKHDGIVFNNREGLLPGSVSYKEYVVPPTSGIGPGTCRIVVGSDNSWYYSPDHYKTFIKFKP